MLSTHFRTPHRPSERDERLLDLYAHHAADLIERLRSDEALRQRAEEIETLMDMLPLGVFVAHDPACRRITGNRAGSELLRLPVGSNLSATPPAGEEPPFVVCRNGRPLPPDQLPMQYAAAHAVDVRGTEVEIVYRDGTSCTLFGSASPLFDAQGRVRGCVASFLDITERKRLEAELRERIGQLHEADRRKDEFLATLAHELRNPLAPIRSALEVLKAEGSGGQDVERVREVMERQVGHMVRLLDDLLDVSRITRNKLKLRKERVELKAVVASAVETSRPAIDGAGHELCVALPAEPVYLNADPVRLSQVLANLLNNAAKYTDPGGHIRLTAERRDHEVVVSVKDNGMGIAAEALPRLFEVFSQAAPAVERSQGGLGIGLALAKRLVQMHGGGVEARSEGRGRGSEFIIRLPMDALPVRQQAQGDGGAVPPAHGVIRHRILVVDDNEDCAEGLAMLVDLMGHEVRIAHDGLDGVAVAEAYRPDVILMDVGMPKLDGYGACRRIRDQSWGRGIVIIAVTGWGQEKDRRRSQRAGFDHHLIKPVGLAALQKVLAGPRAVH